MLVAERAGVIAKQATVTLATRKPDVLLDGLFRHLITMALSQSGLVNTFSPARFVAALFG